MDYQKIEVGMTGAQFIDVINGNNAKVDEAIKSAVKDILLRVLANNVKQIRSNNGNLEFTIDDETWISVNKNEWGSITGDINLQLDLIKLLEDKASTGDIEAVNKTLKSLTSSIDGMKTSNEKMSKEVASNTTAVGNLQNDIKDKISSSTILSFRISAGGYLEYTLDNVAWKTVQSVAEINWGAIGGEVSNQQDLNQLLKSKVNESDFNSHKNSKENPHSVTKEQVGLDQVDNTADKDKPISDAQQVEFDKVNKSIEDLEKGKIAITDDITAIEYCSLEDYNKMIEDDTIDDTVLYIVD